jgi:hypothetical protein
VQSLLKPKYRTKARQIRAGKGFIEIAILRMKPMSQLTQLRSVLHTQFDWHGARLMFLAQFLLALLRVRTVNLAELSTAFVGTSQPESNYKRLQRFLREYRVDYRAFAQGIAGWLKLDGAWTLTLDRTTWEFGNQIHNVLMLGVVYHGVAIPLLWTVLPHRSNSHAHQRIALLHRFRRWFPLQSQACLTADREFIGKVWLKYLVTEHFAYCIRIRECDHLHDGQHSRSSKLIFADLKPSQVKVLPHRWRVGGQWVFVVGLRLADNALLVVITDAHPERALERDALRWQIETLFGCLKSRGFNLEDTHIKRTDRLSRLLVLLTVALVWAIQIGLWQHQLKPLPLKKHGRPLYSLFRRGLDFLRHTVFNLDAQPNLFHQALQFLSCT